MNPRLALKKQTSKAAKKKRMSVKINFKVKQKRKVLRKEANPTMPITTFNDSSDDNVALVCANIL